MKTQIKASDIVEQKLLDFLKSKGYDEKKVLEYVKKYSVAAKAKIHFAIKWKRMLSQVDDLFCWRHTPEKVDFWSDLDKRYRNLN